MIVLLDVFVVILAERFNLVVQLSDFLMLGVGQFAPAVCRTLANLHRGEGVVLIGQHLAGIQAARRLGANPLVNVIQVPKFVERGRHARFQLSHVVQAVRELFRVVVRLGQVLRQLAVIVLQINLMTQQDGIFRVGDGARVIF